MLKAHVAALVATLSLGVSLTPVSIANADPSSPAASTGAACTPVTQARAGSSADRSFLFALQGSQGRLAPVAGKPNAFRLTAPVRSLDDRVVWFADRPARDSGSLSLQDFVELWSRDGANSFKVDPPNVALAHDGKTMIAVMTNPRITTGASGRSLTADLRVVPAQERSALGEGQGQLAIHAKRDRLPGTRKTQALGDFSLFVDNETDCSGDCCCYCIGGSNCGESCAPGVNGLSISPVICGTNCTDYCAIFG